MLAELSAAGAEYLVVGAHALTAHGYMRATYDLDVWVRPSPENARRVWSALVKFGAPLKDVAEQDFQREDLIYQMGVQPVRIDILTSISGVDFETAWGKKQAVKLGDQVVYVISREDLIENKKASGRPKDLLDVDYLERAARRKTK